MLLVGSGCCGGCCCCDKSETIAEVETPVRAEWTCTRKQAWGWDLVWPTYRYHERSIITVHSNREISILARCFEPDPEFAIDPTVERVAYRCREDDPWTLFHLGVRHCLEVPGGMVGQGKTPDWSKAPAFESVVLNIVDSEWWNDKLIDEVEARGEPLLVKLLLASMNRKPCQLVEPFEKAVDRLSEDHRRTVEDAIRADVARPNAKDVAFTYASRRFALEDGDLAAHLLARSDEFVKIEMAKPGSSCAFNETLGSVLPRLALLGHKETGPLACHAFDIHHSNVYAFVPALFVIAHTRTPCEAVKKEQDNEFEVCRALVDCSDDKGHDLCPEAKVLETVREELEAIAADPKKVDDYWSQGRIKRHAVLAAWYAQGPFSARYSMTRARLSYRVAEPHGPSCDDADAAADKPCKCSSRMRDAICGLDPASEHAEHKAGSCMFRVDDQRKVIDITRPAR